MKRWIYLLTLTAALCLTTAVAVPRLFPRVLPTASAAPLQVQDEQLYLPAEFLCPDGESVFCFMDGRARRFRVKVSPVADGVYRLHYGIAADRWLLCGEALTDGDFVKIIKTSPTP